MIDVDLLDANVGEWSAKAERAGPVVLREHGKGRTARDDHQALQAEDECQHLKPRFRV